MLYRNRYGDRRINGIYWQLPVRKNDVRIYAVPYLDLLKEIGKKPAVVSLNLLAFNKAFDYIKQKYGETGWKLESIKTDEERIFLQGTQAVALGKLAGGCRVQTYYPITPAADESEYLEEKPLLETENGGGAIIVMQTEDEIAAITMATGAALTGARSATST